jgi:hypothetical protein
LDSWYPHDSSELRESGIFSVSIAFQWVGYFFAASLLALFEKFVGLKTHATQLNGTSEGSQYLFTKFISLYIKYPKLEEAS